MPEEKRKCIERILDYTAQMSTEGQEKFLFIAEGFQLGLSAAICAQGRTAEAFEQEIGA